MGAWRSSARLSAARYNYQTEMRGRRPEQVKAYLDEAARLYPHRQVICRVSPTKHGMNLLSPVVKVFFGLGLPVPSHVAQRSAS
jgi:hypothetical protein